MSIINYNVQMHSVDDNNNDLKLFPKTKIENIDNLQNILTSLQSALPQTQKLKHSFSSADTWEYTGLSVTVPASQGFIMIASITWDSGKPTGLVLSETDDPTLINFSNILGLIEPDPAGQGQYMLTITCQSTVPSTQTKTFYLYAKNASASGKSNIRITTIRVE